MYYICRRSAFCVINVFNQNGGKQRWIVSSHQYSSSFFSVSWEMAPTYLAWRRCFICNVPEKSKMKILLKSHDIFFVFKRHAQIENSNRTPQRLMMCLNKAENWSSHLWTALLMGKIATLKKGSVLVLVIRNEHRSWLAHFIYSV